MEEFEKDLNLVLSADDAKNLSHEGAQEEEGPATVATNPVPSSSTKIAAPTGGKPATQNVTPALSTAKVVSPTAITGGAGAKPVSLGAALNARVGVGLKIPAGLKGIDTSKTADIHDYWHGMIYSETSARKTTTAAKMFGKENTLIILCRQPEQLIPLRGQGYRVLHAQDSESLVFALQYPEEAAAKLLDWPEWATLKDRAIVFDDVTEGVGLLLDRHSTNDEGKERKDMRQVYKFAGGELKSLFDSLKRKPLHLTLIALAKVSTNDITYEEVIRPDLPPSMHSFITTDIEFVFYIDKTKWKFVTESVYRAYTGTDEKTGKEKIFRREIFGKRKLPTAYAMKVFPPTHEVSMSKDPLGEDLAHVWRCVKSGTPIEPPVQVKK